MNRKGQEEIAGFVAIIVIVTIVGIIILGLLMRGDSGQNEGDNRDLLRFLEGSLVYTSNCTLDFGYTYKNVKELAKICYSKPESECLNGEGACTLLNQTLQGILIAAWGEIDNSSYVKGYRYSFEIVKKNSSENQNKVFLDLGEGECSSNFRSYSLPISTNPNIQTRIKLCTS